MDLDYLLSQVPTSSLAEQNNIDHDYLSTEIPRLSADAQNNMDQVYFYHPKYQHRLQQNKPV